jgi:hypothetical protein
MLRCHGHGIIRHFAYIQHLVVVTSYLPYERVVKVQGPVGLLANIDSKLYYNQVPLETNVI